ncbi:MAG: ribosome-associated translation inhibitor RaiA [Syntrophomonadaceae bacterium]|nr:ribosome-associated translation inhibitor RaiA [Syntrophomonadaceae bacterium]
MRITVRGKNIEVTDALRDYVTKRLGKLDKYLELDEAQVTLLVERGNHVIEVTIPINGMILRGEEETSDMYSSIDLVVEKLEKQLEKYKTKLLSRRMRTQPNVTVRELPTNLAELEKEEEDAPKILRTKRFAMKPMPVDEAVLQMNLLGHSFFVFTNADTEEVNVVYRRKDGNYGLIEPYFA